MLVDYSKQKAVRIRNKAKAAESKQKSSQFEVIESKQKSSQFEVISRIRR